MMKRLTTALLVSIATQSIAAVPPKVDAPQSEAPATAVAPSAERVALARQLMDSIALTDNTMDMLHASVWEMASNGIGDEHERSVAKIRMDRVFARHDPEIRQAMPKFVDAYAQAYAREFSADELQQLIVFAQSPVGKHYTRQGTSLMGEPAIREAQVAVWSSLSVLMSDFAKEMCAQHTEERIAAGDIKAKCPLADPETRAS